MAGIGKIREKCDYCNLNAPSQPRDPPEKVQMPKYPFHHLWADLFEAQGNNYLVVVDGYSSWPIIYHCKRSTSSEIIKIFRKIFTSYGAPTIVTTDGGKCFTSSEFENL